jgi:signal transduction histidine kinase
MFHDRAARLERLLEVGRSLTAELDTDLLLQQILDTARDLTGAQYAALGVLDERRRELEQFITAGADPEVHAAIGHLPRGRGILGLLIDQPEPISVHDVARHARSYGFPPGHPPMHSFLGVPVLIRGQAWGNLYLTEKAGGEDFDEDDIEATIVLSQWAGIAIDNARMYGEAESRRRELERAVRSMTTSMDIAIALGGETDLERILELIVKRGRALVEADALLIWLRNGSQLNVAAWAGAADVPDDAVIPLEGSTAGDVLRSGDARRIDDVQTGLAIPPSRYGMADARSALLVPLMYRGRGLGVLTAFDRIGSNVRFDGDDERALRAFAASAATAVATARSVEEQRLRDSIAAAESERRRWARELHDETLQGMASLKLALSTALRSDADAARPVVEAAVRQLEADIASLRAIIADLRPASLDELGLEPALRTLVARVTAPVGLAATLDVDLGSGRLPADVETIAYRVAQEALTNVVKHADATKVNISLRLQEGELRLSVVDDGRGVTPHEDGEDLGDSSGGYGIVGMRERAALGNGRIEIGPARDRGTAVRLIIPTT